MYACARYRTNIYSFIAHVTIQADEKMQYSFPHMRFQILTAASVNIAAFWDISPCSLVEEDWRLRGAYCLHHRRPEDLVSLKHDESEVRVSSCHEGDGNGGSTHLWNVGLLQWDYATLYHRRMSSSVHDRGNGSIFITGTVANGFCPPFLIHNIPPRTCSYKLKQNKCIYLFEYQVFRRLQ
jgi:hypothetical protein